MNGPIRSIAIAGGDVSAWIVAAALAKELADHAVQVTVVERAAKLPQAADSTAPSILSFHRKLAIDERDFIRATGAGFKLGSAYENWVCDGHRFVHAFGSYGSMLNSVEFQHFACKLRSEGDTTSYDEYSIAATAAKMGRFALPVADPRSIYSQMVYSLHVSNSEYRRYLRAYSLQRGVQHVEAEVVSATRRRDDGFVEALVVDSGENVAADFFFDCTGTDGVLAGTAPGAAFEDWSPQLPCDRRLSVRREIESPRRPYTTMQPMDSGWRRSVPLRSEVIEECHYCSDYVSEDDVVRQLANVSPTADIAVENLSPGRRREFWSENCAAIGLSAGYPGDFVTSAHHLSQSAILRWIDCYPDRRCNPDGVQEYNRATGDEYARVLDSHVLHYLSVHSRDSEFWKSAREIAVPESLAHKLALFEGRGSVAFYESETLLPQTWAALMIGLDHWPRRYDPLAGLSNGQPVKDKLAEIRQVTKKAVGQMQSYDAFLAAYGDATVGQHG